MSLNGSDQHPILLFEDVSKHFATGQRFLRFRQPDPIRAVDQVTLCVAAGSTRGLVGESGSGKTTLARLAARLTPVTSGRVVLDGVDITDATGQKLREIRRDMQMVFQNPYASFDPTARLVETVAEPLQAFQRVSRSERRDLVEAAFALVGLRQGLSGRYPRQLSGGQLQRAAIARALVTEPKMLVLDEPLSALDVSTQSQILNLLSDLQERLGLTYLLVAHDLAVVRHVTDQVSVMYLGRIVEDGPTERVYRAPAHPYTAALLAATPSPNPRRRTTARETIAGETPSPRNLPSGCRFRTRCPWVMEVCHQIDPAAYITPEGTTVHCHLHTTGPTLEGASVMELGRPPKPGVAARGGK